MLGPAICSVVGGPSVTLTSITNAAGFFLSVMIQIPAIENFAIQVNCLCMLCMTTSILTQNAKRTH